MAACAKGITVDFPLASLELNETRFNIGGKLVNIGSKLVNNYWGTNCPLGLVAWAIFAWMLCGLEVQTTRDTAHLHNATSLGTATESSPPVLTARLHLLLPLTSPLLCHPCPPPPPPPTHQLSLPPVTKQEAREEELLSSFVVLYVHRGHKAY